MTRAEGSAWDCELLMVSGTARTAPLHSQASCSQQPLMLLTITPALSAHHTLFPDPCTGSDPALPTPAWSPQWGICTGIRSSQICVCVFAEHCCLLGCVLPLWAHEMAIRGLRSAVAEIQDSAGLTQMKLCVEIRSMQGPMTSRGQRKQSP